MTIRIGTAGWSIPKPIAHQFPAEGTGLERYSARFPVAEINSSFHRPHRASTWERWRNSVPADFRFSVKLPKTITHQAKLRDCADLLHDFLDSAHLLGKKLAVLLIQLPPKLEFDPATAREFFAALADRSPSLPACEPRHASWFTPEAGELLENMRVARVGADPAICEEAARTGGWRGLSYWRLHGSPVVYRSSYADRIPDYADRLLECESSGSEAWCILDNTASSAGAGDALALIDAIGNSAALPVNPRP